MSRHNRVIVWRRVFLVPRPLATTSRCLRGSCDRSTALRLSWRRSNFSCLAPKLKAQLAKLLKLEARPCQLSAQERSSTMSGAGSRPQRGEEPRHAAEDQGGSEGRGLLPLHAAGHARRLLLRGVVHFRGQARGAYEGCCPRVPASAAHDHGQVQGGYGRPRCQFCIRGGGRALARE